MSVVAFDTLAYSNKLQESGMPREQAEAIARANVEAFRSLVVTQQLATKEDIADLREEILATRWELEKKIDNGDKNSDTHHTELEKKITGFHNDLDKKIDNVYGDLNQKIETFHSELDKKIDYVYGDLNQKIETFRSELDKKIDNVHNELDKKIDNVRSALEIKMDESRLQMLKWMIGLIVGLGAVLMTFISYMK